jgi:lipid-binding SYLF domain-containing protein
VAPALAPLAALTPPRKPRTKRIGIAVVGLLALAGEARAGLLGPKGEDVAEQQATVRRQRGEMLAELYRSRPEMRQRVADAAGYATFRQTDMNLFLLASANGYGVVVDNGSGRETFMRVASLGGGAGMGVKDVRVVFVFNDPEVMRQFVEQGWQFGARADVSAKYQDTGVAAEQNVKSVVDLEGGTAATAASSDARAGSAGEGTDRAAAGTSGAIEVYQFTESGISLQATVAGTKYWQDSKLNP